MMLPSPTVLTIKLRRPCDSPNGHPSLALATESAGKTRSLKPICPGDLTLVRLQSYQGKSVADFLGSLHKAWIELVIDVRELPLSRRRGFSKTPLSLALQEANIGYTHLRQAGNPYRAERADLKRCFALRRWK